MLAEPPTAMLLLTAMSGAAAALDDRLAQTARGSASRSLGAAFLQGSAHGTALAGQQLHDFLLLVPIFDAAAEAGLVKLLEPARRFLDLDRCSAIVGRKRLHLPGAGPLQLVMAWRRRAPLSAEAAQAIWHDEHGVIVRAHGSRTGYCQFHASLTASARLALEFGFDDAPFDGAVLNHAESLEALAATFAHSAVSGAALTDERRFIDHSRSTLQAFAPLEASL